MPLAGEVPLVMLLPDAPVIVGEVAPFEVAPSLPPEAADPEVADVTTVEGLVFPEALGVLLPLVFSEEAEPVFEVGTLEPVPETAVLPFVVWPLAEPPGAPLVVAEAEPELPLVLALALGEAPVAVQGIVTGTLITFEFSDTVTVDTISLPVAHSVPVGTGTVKETVVV